EFDPDEIVAPVLLDEGDEFDLVEEQEPRFDVLLEDQPPKSQGSPPAGKSSRSPPAGKSSRQTPPDKKAAAKGKKSEKSDKTRELEQPVPEKKEEDDVLIPLAPDDGSRE